MSKKMKDKRTVTNVSSTSINQTTSTARDSQAETTYKLGKIIAKLFNVSPKVANLISKTLMSLAGSVVSIVTVVLALLKGLGVI